MHSIPLDNENERPTGTERSVDGRALDSILLVGGVMVALYLLVAVISPYESLFLAGSGFAGGQFAFLKIIFPIPSPAYSALAEWQAVLLFEVVPFLLFFDLAVRLHIDPVNRIRSIIVPAVATGFVVSLASFTISNFQYQITSLLQTGHVLNETGVQAFSPSVVFTYVLDPSTLLFAVAAAVLFTCLALAGLSFGAFAGKTPYWMIRGWLTPTEAPDGTLDDGPQTD
jgi:hypothetical protein